MCSLHLSYVVGPVTTLDISLVYGQPCTAAPLAVVGILSPGVVYVFPYVVGPVAKDIMPNPHRRTEVASWKSST